MKKTIISIMTAVTLLGSSSMSHAQCSAPPTQSANASPCNPMMMADTGMTMNGMDMKSKQMEAATHRGTGTVKKIDTAKVTLSHGPIATLNWPAMTMGFKLKDPALAKGIKAGDVVDFELVKSGSSYVVTRMQLSGK